jgi:hypothetical protein
MQTLRIVGYCGQDSTNRCWENRHRLAIFVATYAHIAQENGLIGTFVHGVGDTIRLRSLRVQE